VPKFDIPHEKEVVKCNEVWDNEAIPPNGFLDFQEEGSSNEYKVELLETSKKDSILEILNVVKGVEYPKLILSLLAYVMALQD
ncbi:hypothetical protein KI387_008460, partial [Taxus chinensis]